MTLALSKAKQVSVLSVVSCFRLADSWVTRVRAQSQALARMGGPGDATYIVRGGLPIGLNIRAPGDVTR